MTRVQHSLGSKSSTSRKEIRIFSFTGDSGWGMAKRLTNDQILLHKF